MKKDDGFMEKAGQIRQLASLPPDQLTDHLTTTHPNISTTAPNVAPHVFSAASNAIQFLNSKLPPTGNELPQDELPSGSQAQKAQWLDLHQLVNDPVSVLDHVKNNTLTSHHLEALQSVYPDLHEEMKDKIMEEVGALQNSKTSIPYSRRVMISKFIGLPLDSTLTPESFQAIMQANSGPQQEQEGGGQKPAKNATSAAVSQMNKVTQLSQTPVQSQATSQVSKD